MNKYLGVGTLIAATPAMKIGVWQWFYAILIASFSAGALAFSNEQLVDQRLRALLNQWQTIPSLNARLITNNATNLAVAIELLNPTGCEEANYLVLLQRETPCLNPKPEVGGNSCIRANDENPAQQRRWEELAKAQGYLKFGGFWLVRLPAHQDPEMALAQLGRAASSGNRNALAAILGLEALNRLIASIGAWEEAQIVDSTEGIRRLLGVCRSPQHRDDFIIEGQKRPASDQHRRSDNREQVAKGKSAA